MITTKYKKILSNPDNKAWKFLTRHCRDVYVYKDLFVLKRALNDSEYEQNMRELDMLLSNDIPKSIHIGKYDYKVVVPEVVNYDRGELRTWIMMTYIGPKWLHKWASGKYSSYDKNMVTKLDKTLDPITECKIRKHLLNYDLSIYNIYVDHKTRTIYWWDLGYE